MPLKSDKLWLKTLDNLQGCVWLMPSVVFYTFSFELCTNTINILFSLENPLQSVTGCVLVAN